MSRFELMDVSEDIYGDGIGKVELWDGSWSNLNHQERANIVAKVATLSYGNKDAKKPMSLYRRLIKMGHLSVTEFIRSPTIIRNGWVASDVGLLNSLRNTPMKTWEESFGDNIEGINNIQQYTKSQVATFKIKCPMYIRSQFQRHRTFSYLELSRRYTKPSKVKFEFFRSKGTVDDFNENCQQTYLSRLSNKETPETARGSIPMDAYTEFWCSADVDGLANFLNLRLDPHAQEPIRLLSQAINDLLKESQPTFYTNVTERAEKMKEEYLEFSSGLLSEIKDL